MLFKLQKKIIFIKFIFIKYQIIDKSILAKNLHKYLNSKKNFKIFFLKILISILDLEVTPKY